MIRLYISDTLSADSEVTLSPEASHYLSSVMRRKEGDSILLFNSQDGEFQADIIKTHKKATLVQVTQQTRTFFPCPTRYLLFSPLKPKIMEFLIEKGTELGVTDFMPTTMRHSASHKINVEKWERYAIEAAEQSERLDIPKIHPIATLEKRLSTWNTNVPLFVGDETHSSPSLDKQTQAQAAFMVGPEGGFHRDELSKMKEFSWV